MCETNFSLVEVKLNNLGKSQSFNIFALYNKDQSKIM